MSDNLTQNPETATPAQRGSRVKGSALLKATPLYARLEATRADHLSDVKKWLPSVLGVFRRAYAGKSMKAALQAFCIECQGFDDARAGIRDCTAYACPLWEYRPYQGRRA